MRRIKRVGLAVASVLALAASIGATSASAFTVWQVDGVNVAGGTSVVTTFSFGALQFRHSGGLGGNFTIECSGNGVGTVRSVGVSTVDSITLTSCTTTSGTCASPRVVPANLTWTAQFSGSRNSIGPGPSGRNPGWTLTCSGFSATCTAATNTAIVNSSPNVLAIYDSLSATASCTDFGTMTVIGTVTNSIAGHTLKAA
jgi:hypothetical protein